MLILFTCALLIIIASFCLVFGLLARNYQARQRYLLLAAALICFLLVIILVILIWRNPLP